MLTLSSFYIEKIWGHEEQNLSNHKKGYSTVVGSYDTLLNNLGEEILILIKRI